MFYIGDSRGFKHTKLYSTYCFHTKSSLVIILLVGISYPLTFTIGYTTKQKWHKILTNNFCMKISIVL